MSSAIHGCGSEHALHGFEDVARCLDEVVVKVYLQPLGVAVRHVHLEDAVDDILQSLV